MDSGMVSKTIAQVKRAKKPMDNSARARRSCFG